MNELQKKLARRRSLNGELGGAPTADHSEEGPAVGTLSREPSTEIRKDAGGISQPKSTGSSQSELQAKLARRRNMNGEQITPQKSQPEPSHIVSQPTSAPPDHEFEKRTIYAEDGASEKGRIYPADEATKRLSEKHLSVLNTIATEEHTESAPAQTITPAWLDNLSVTDNGSANCENHVDETVLEVTHKVNVQEKHVLAPAVEAPQAEAVITVEEIATSPTFEPLSENAKTDKQELVAADAIEVVATPELPATAALHPPPADTEQDTIPSEESVEQVATETPPATEAPPVPAITEPTDNHHTTTNDVPPPAAQPPLALEREPEALVMEKVAIPFALVSPVAKSAPEMKLEVPKPAAESRTEAGTGSQSPSRSRVSWSPLRYSVAAGPATSTSPVPQRTTSNTGAARTSTTSISPVRRTASLSGAPSASQSMSAKRSSWYPGKFLMEGLSSKQNTPRFKMNPEAARNHYADLMSSSAKEFPTADAAPITKRSNNTGGVEPNSSANSPTSGYTASSSQQREEALREADLPDMVAAGSSDDIIDKVLELSRENGQLKKEVMMLRAEVLRQKAIIAALSGENIDVLPAAVPVDRKLEFTDMETVPNVATTTATASDSTSEKGHSATSEASATGPMSAGTKNRASKRFARGFYSNYGGEDDEDDNLFGTDDATPTSGANNFNLSKLALDDLGDGTGTTSHAKRSSIGDGFGDGVDSSAQSLDKLLNSVTGSGHKDKDGARGLVGEKLLVQSFMSTSMVHGKPSDDRAGQEKGDWSERFGSLGLISSNAEVDDHLFNEEKDSKAQQRAAATEAQNAVMDYQEFLGKFTKTTELVNMTRDFIFSILGPNGDATPPVGRKKLNYIFYGLHKLDVRCRDFFDQVEGMFSKWPEFAGDSDERTICARDGVEQYVMQRIAEYAFKSVVDTEGDALLARRMKLLSFLRPEALDIKPELFSETLLAMAGDELRKINACKTPGDKVACVVKSVSVIFRCLSLSKSKSESDSALSSTGEDNNIAGADDFLPLFIWVVMRSHVPRLCSNVAYVQAFLNPARLMGKWGYCLINLSSALEFVKYIESDQLAIDPREFDMKLTEAERELNGGFL